MSRAAAQSVHTWIVCVTGFTQTEGRRSGIQLLQHELHEQCSGAGSRVLLKHWRDCMEGLAQRIWNWKPPVDPPHIVIVGYSYGGYTATLLATSLEGMGLAVDSLYLIDPVWRPRASGASLLSLYRGWQIEIPPNVRKLWYWSQVASRWTEPQGHQLKILGDTKLMNATQPPLKVSHAFIDDASAIHSVVAAGACPHLQRQPFQE